MLHTVEDRRHVILLDSVSDLTNNLLEILPKARYRHGCFGKNLRDVSFMGRCFYSAEEAIEAATQPWPEGLAILQGMIRDLEVEDTPPPRSIRRRQVWSDEGGDEVSVDRLQRGIPFWRSSKRDAMPGPAVITIVTDIGAFASVNHLDILWKGAATISLAYLLEASGYRVEIQMAELTHHVYHRTDNPNHLASIVLKRPEEPLDISTLICAVSGWFFRSCWFMSFFLTEEPLVVGWLGAPGRMSQKELSKFTPDQDVILSEGIWSRYAAVEWVKSSLKKIEAKHQR